MKIVIGHLNIYGDNGNILALEKRAKWRGIQVEVKNISLKEQIKPGEIDLFFFGGGQDQAQELVAKDLIKSGKGKIIKREVEKGIPLLSICGGYQLLGEYYQPHNKPKLVGAGVFPAYTEASFDRMIGNIVIQTSFGKLVGFENHSGKTYLSDQAKPLGKVQKGFGNNGKDRFEGCFFQNAIGCYMHGSLLPKNPKLADWLIQKALEIKYNKKIRLNKLNDALENKAHNSTILRFG
jgi:hypothetical protein